MVSGKRMFIATIFGLIFGFLAWLLARPMTSADIPWYGALAIILNRTVLGFAIGISVLRMSWWLHGLLLGLIFSLPQAFGALWVGMQWAPEFVLTLVVGMVIGFLIELITSIVFKASSGFQPESQVSAA